MVVFLSRADGRYGLAPAHYAVIQIRDVLRAHQPEGAVEGFARRLPMRLWLDAPQDASLGLDCRPGPWRR